MKKKLKNIVRLKKISTIKDFRFGTFPSISGSGSGCTFYRPPSESGKCNIYILTMKINHTLWLIEVIILFRRWIHRWKYIFIRCLFIVGTTRAFDRLRKFADINQSPSFDAACWNSSTNIILSSILSHIYKHENEFFFFFFNTKMS